MSDPKMVDPIEVVENEKEQADGYTSVWCVTGLIRRQNRSVDTGDPEMRESPFVFNVVARQPAQAAKAYYAKAAELNQLGDLVAQVTIESVKWVARVDAT